MLFLLPFAGCVVSDNRDRGVHALVNVALVHVRTGLGERKAECFAFSGELCLVSAVRLLRCPQAGGLVDSLEAAGGDCVRDRLVVACPSSPLSSRDRTSASSD